MNKNANPNDLIGNFIDRFSGDFQKTPNRFIEETYATPEVAEPVPVKKVSVSKDDYEEGPARVVDAPQPATPGMAPGTASTGQMAVNPDGTITDAAYSTPTTAGLTEDPEKVRQNQEFFSKYLLEIVDKAQSVGLLFAYDNWATPEARINRRDALNSKVYAGAQLNDVEAMELKQLNELLDKFSNARDQYAETLGYDEWAKEYAKTFLAEYMAINNYQPNPLMLLLMVLFGKPIMSGTTILQHKMRFSK